MKKRKKICFILPTLHAGGIENYTLRFAKHVKGRMDLTLVCLNQQRGDLHNRFTDLGVRVHYRRIGYLNLLGFIRLYRFFRQNRFDGLVDFTGNFAGMRMVIAKIAGLKKRIVFYRRSNNAFKSQWIKNTYNCWANHLVYRYATHIFSNSRYALQYFFPETYDRDRRFKVIPNGVDATWFDPQKVSMNARGQLGIPTDVFVVGHLGRYDPAKNHDTILKVACAMMRAHEDVVFVFCGKGTDSQAFKNTLLEAGYAQRLLALGLQDDIPSVLKVMDAFYFPSLAEGQPNALIEAMLMDLPIVAANIEPILEATPPAAHPFLIPPMDVKRAVDALMQIKNKRIGNYIGYRQWATEHFDQHRNFTLLEDEL